MTVTVKRIGGSLAVIIPSAIATESRLEEGTAFDVSSTTAAILFRRPGRRQRRRIGELAKRINSASYARRNVEILSDAPVGREIA